MKATDYNPNETKSFSLGYTKRPFIKFVKSSDSTPSYTDESIIQDTATTSTAASFYRNLVRSTRQDLSSNTESPVASLPVCEVCQVPIHDADRHHLNASHLSALSNPQSPVSPLSIDPESAGYRYLVKHGWSPFDAKGLGAAGREGSRIPVRVEVKNNTYGVGGKRVAKNVAAVAKPIVRNAEDAKRFAEGEKRKRKRVYQELYGDAKVNEYFGIE